MRDPASEKPPYRLLQPWNRIPELQHLPEKVRFDIWERANTASRLGCLATIVCFVWVLFLLDGFVVEERALLSETIFARLFYEFKELSLLATVIIFPPLLYRLHLRSGRRAVQRWLVEVGCQRATACIECGYSLVGTPADSTQCPECGKTIPQAENDSKPGCAD